MIFKENALNKARKTQFSHIISEDNKAVLKPLQIVTFQLKPMDQSSNFTEEVQQTRKKQGAFYASGPSLAATTLKRA